MKRVITVKFPESENFDIVDEMQMPQKLASEIEYELNNIQEKFKDSDPNDILNHIPAKLYESISAKLNNLTDSMRDTNNVWKINMADMNEYLIDIIEKYILKDIDNDSEIKMGISKLLRGESTSGNEYLDDIFTEICEPINSEINEIMSIVNDFDEEVDQFNINVFYYY